MTPTISTPPYSPRQDPLYGLNQLAAQVKAAGITKVIGDVAVDDRFFEPYRMPNQHLLITPVMVNENMVDVTVTPTQPGQPVTVVYRPKTAAFTVQNNVATGPPGSKDTVKLSDTSIMCIGQSGCGNTISGSIPQDYKAPITGDPPDGFGSKTRPPLHVPPSSRPCNAKS